MSRFRDHFSGHAREYSRWRPRYPAEVYRWLASRVERHDLCWDCATGNGQAARGLAPHFRRVVASDASVEQIALAPAMANVDYVVALSTMPGAGRSCADLVTVAQAMHWFDLEPFYREVEQMLVPGGVIAAWTYSLLRSTPVLDSLIDRFVEQTVGPFWPPQRRHVEAGYADLAFPFDEITAPEFVMRATWTIEELMAYLETWSSVRRFWSARGFSPVADLEHELRDIWGPPETAREMRWRLALRVGRHERS